MDEYRTCCVLETTEYSTEVKAQEQQKGAGNGSCWLFLQLWFLSPDSGAGQKSTSRDGEDIGKNRRQGLVAKTHSRRNRLDKVL